MVYLLLFLEKEGKKKMGKQTSKISWGKKKKIRSEQKALTLQSYKLKCENKARPKSNKHQVDQSPLCHSHYMTRHQQL